MHVSILPSEFYDRPTLLVARELIGKRLVRMEGETRLSGVITETEAYIGEEDLGCHAKAGRTPRTTVMFGPAGHAYVYFTYGMHWMLNAISEQEGFPAAVLLRAIQPLEGLEIIQARRNGRDCDGPAKLTQALGIGGEFNRCNLTDPASGLWIEEADPILDEFVTVGSRVGLYTVPEPWKSKPWRFQVKKGEIASLTCTALRSLAPPA
jgi:DNA-3-methyladenine glycosylase